MPSDRHPLLADVEYVLPLRWAEPDPAGEQVASGWGWSVRLAPRPRPRKGRGRVDGQDRVDPREREESEDRWGHALQPKAQTRGFGRPARRDERCQAAWVHERQCAEIDGDRFPAAAAVARVGASEERCRCRPRRRLRRRLRRVLESGPLRSSSHDRAGALAGRFRRDGISEHEVLDVRGVDAEIHTPGDYRLHVREAVPRSVRPAGPAKPAADGRRRIGVTSTTQPSRA